MMNFKHFTRALTTFCVLLLFTAAHADPPHTVNLMIRGVEDPLKANILTRLNTELDAYNHVLTADQAATFTEEGKEQVLLAMQPYGYFNPDIKGYHASIPPTSWDILYNITPSEPTRVAHLDLEIMGPGQDDPAFKALEEKLPIKEGRIFTAHKYELAQKKLFTIAQNNGFIQGILSTHTATIDKASNEAAVVLYFETGERYYFGDISFTNSKYDESFLRRYLNIMPGDIYAADKLQALQSMLNNTPYFSQVSVEPQLAKAKDQHVPILIHLTDSKSQQYNIGAGYGSNTGARTSIGMDFQRVTDTGQHLSTLLNLSEVNTGLTTKYYIPGPHPERNQYTLGAVVRNFSPENGHSYPRQLSVGYDTTYKNLYHLSLNLNALNEKFEARGNDYQTVNMYYPSLYAARISTNDPVMTTRGSRIAFNLKAADPLSATDFVQGEADGKWVFPITDQNTFMVRGDIGSTYATDFDRVPLSLRFFAGGVGSVRGYGYESLGPGKYLKTGSVELQQHIYNSFYTSVFYDVGDATDDLSTDLKRGAGIGLTWRTPVGPINLYIAKALSTDGEPYRIELSFGVGL